VNAAAHPLERTSTDASPYTVIIAADNETAETLKDFLSLLNNATAGIGVVNPSDIRWNKWLGEGGRLEISVQASETLPSYLSDKKGIVDKHNSTVVDQDVSYFVCPSSGCKLLQLKKFKEANIQILDFHATEDGEEELPKAKKIKIQRLARNQGQKRDR